jgi:CXXX repeat modification system protein
MKKKAGKVTVEEKDKILSLYERRNGLMELAKIAGSNDALYEKVVADLGSTNVKFQNWWNEMSNKYRWESCENGRWEIDFDSCNIYIDKPDL